MSTRYDDEFGERIKRATRAADRADRPRKETPEAYGRRVADELFAKAVQSIEDKRRQN